MYQEARKGAAARRRGRPRHYGRFDTAPLAHTRAMNDMDGVVFTKLDVLPKNAQEYVMFIETIYGTNTVSVAAGPSRNLII